MWTLKKDIAEGWLRNPGRKSWPRTAGIETPRWGGLLPIARGAMELGAFRGRSVAFANNRKGHGGFQL